MKSLERIGRRRVVKDGNEAAANDDDCCWPLLLLVASQLSVLSGDGPTSPAKGAAGSIAAWPVLVSGGACACRLSGPAPELVLVGDDPDPRAYSYAEGRDRKDSDASEKEEVTKPAIVRGKTKQMPRLRWRECN